MTRQNQTCAALLLLALSGCAHVRPETAEAPPTPMVWPPPPAEARIRLVGFLPDPSAPPPHRPWWRVLLGWVVGTGSDGDDGPLLPRPFGVALMDDGSTWVADPDGGKVVRFDAQRTPSLVTCPKTAWQAPMALVQGADAAVYVADAGAATITRWTAQGCTTVGTGLFERPTGLAATPSGLWVVDPPRHQVVALTYAGEVLRTFGRRGEGEGAFSFPSSAAPLPHGGVAIVDALNFRIVLLDADGRWTRTFGERGDQGGEFSLPKGIAATPDAFLVTDAQRDVVLVFGADGVFRYAVGETGAGPGQFTHPAGVALAGNRVAVADSYNHRVQLFELLGGTP